MFVPDSIKERIDLKIKECLKKATIHYNPVAFSTPRVSYTLRGTVGGMANLTTWTILVNSILLMENLEDYIENTIPHEVAHLIDYKVHGIQYKGRKQIQHGYTWQQVMRVFGCDPSRCHSYDVSRAQVKKKAKYHYKCKGCAKDFFLGPVRHKKILGGAQYWCTRCGYGRGTLVLQQARTLGRVSVDEARAIVGAQAVERARAAAMPPVVVSTGNTGSKKEKALAFYRENNNLQVFINRCMSELNMTRAGATTYFYMCRKEA